MKHIILLALLLLAACSNEPIYIYNYTNSTDCEVNESEFGLLNTSYITINYTVPCPECESCEACPICQEEDTSGYRETIQDLQVRLVVCEERSIRNWTLYECEAEVEILEDKINESREFVFDLYKLIS